MAWGADWCIYCERNKPELKRLHKTGKYVIMFIDYDKHKAFARSIGIKSLPTYYVVDKKGNPLLKTTSLKTLKAYKPKRTSWH